MLFAPYTHTFIRGCSNVRLKHFVYISYMINILNKLDSFTISPAGSELQQIYLRCTILFSCLFFTISTNVGILCHSPYPNKGKWATHLLMFFRLHNRIIVNILLLVNSMPIIIFRPETMQRFPITIFSRNSAFVRAAAKACVQFYYIIMASYTHYIHLHCHSPFTFLYIECDYKRETF